MKKIIKKALNKINLDSSLIKDIKELKEQRDSLSKISIFKRKELKNKIKELAKQLRKEIAEIQ